MFFSHLILINCLKSLSAFGPINKSSSAKDSNPKIIFFSIVFCCLVVFLAASWLLFTQQGKNLRSRTIDSLPIKYGIRSKKSALNKTNERIEIEMMTMKKKSA